MTLSKKRHLPKFKEKVRALYILEGYSIRETIEKLKADKEPRIPDKNTLCDWFKSWEDDRTLYLQEKRKEDIRKWSKVDDIIDNGLAQAVMKYFKRVNDDKVEVKGGDVANFIRQWEVRRGRVSDRVDNTFKVIIEEFKEDERGTKDKAP